MPLIESAKVHARAEDKDIVLVGDIETRGSHPWMAVSAELRLEGLDVRSPVRLTSNLLDEGLGQVFFHDGNGIAMMITRLANGEYVIRPRVGISITFRVAERG